MAPVKERGGGGEKGSFPSPPPSFIFFGSRSISRAAETENPVPRSFFVPKPNRKACYTG